MSRDQWSERYLRTTLCSVSTAARINEQTKQERERQLDKLHKKSLKTQENGHLKFRHTKIDQEYSYNTSVVFNDYIITFKLKMADDQNTQAAFSCNYSFRLRFCCYPN